MIVKSRAGVRLPLPPRPVPAPVPAPGISLGNVLIHGGWIMRYCLPEEVHMRNAGRIFWWVMAAAMAWLALGCGQQQWKFDTLPRRDRLRFAACRHDVSRHLCADDPDCDVKSADMYAAEPAHARLQFLLDYKCPREKIQHVDDIVKREEQGSIGMQEGQAR
jgi:hypothetical protein